jgi:hypothetical protein
MSNCMGGVDYTAQFRRFVPPKLTVSSNQYDNIGLKCAKQR